MQQPARTLVNTHHNAACREVTEVNSAVLTAPSGDLHPSWPRRE